jgi:hypothetical protein
MFGGDPLIKCAFPKLSLFAAKLLRDEAIESLSYSCHEIHSVDAGNLKQEFEVTHMEDTNKNSPWTVRIDINSKVGTCSCRKDVWHGIPCRHLLRGFRQVGVFDIVPYNLIKRRWFKENDKSTPTTNITPSPPNPCISVQRA